MKWSLLVGLALAACAPCTETNAAPSEVLCGATDAGVTLATRLYTNLNPPGLLACTGVFDGTTLTFTTRLESCENGSTAPAYIECTIPQLPDGRYPLPGGTVLVLPNDGGVAGCDQ